MVQHVHLIVLTQKISCTDCKKMNLQGHNNFHVDVILNNRLFGGDCMRNGVDIMVILGNFSLESKSLPPKRLFVTWNGMLTNEQRDFPQKQ